jgi:transposase
MTGMTKGSTLTVGVDLGDEYSQLCVLDADAEVIEEGRIRTTEAAFRSRFKTIEPCLTVIEVGTHSPWLSRLLQSLGHECLVANPAALHRKGRKKNDRVDAEKLARRGRSDPQELESIQHASAEIQADMAIVHSRRSLVEARTKLISRCRGLVKSWGQRLPKCDADYFARRMAAVIPPALEPAVAPLLQTIALLTAQIRDLDNQIEELASTKYGEATLHMRQVKGVGALTSLCFALTLRDPQRFAKSRQVGPYLGLTRRQDQSGSSDVEHSISKAGNVYLRQLLVQSAHYVLERGPDTDIRRWGVRLAAGGKRAKRRAIVAVARKLAVLMHHLWLTGDDYVALREAVPVKDRLLSHGSA